MPEFEYQAVSRDEFKNGRLQADSESEAQTVLNEQGLTVISLTKHLPLQIGIFTGLFSRLETRFRERMSISEKVLFTSQLSSMIKAGLPLIEALSAFIDRQNGSGSVRIIDKIIVKLQSGTKLSEALADFPQTFPPAYLAVIKSGENSGTLADSLSYLAEQLRREADLANKVKSALIYPAVVVTAMIAVMTFISISVVPKILLFAQASGQQLPGYTLLLINLVNLVTRYWYLLGLLLIILIISFIIFARSPSGSFWLGKLSLHLPIIGALTARYNQARFARMLGGFYLYGVSIITSFDILAESLDNPVFRQACYRIKKRLTLGQSLAESVQQESQIFPSIMVRLIKGAEKTGDLGNTLDKLARYYEEELEVALKNVLTLIEPALVFILGFGVLGLALMVIVPIYKITSSLK